MHLSWSAENKSLKKKKKKKARRRMRREVGVDVPPEIAAEPELAKYWAQRYRLFSRFDEGVKLDHGQSDLYLSLKINIFLHFPLNNVMHFGIGAP